MHCNLFNGRYNDLEKEITNPSILTSINLDGLAKGTYLLVVTTKNSIERKKIVIR
ncbi:MAG: T9SS type A sorting domain-containing protein [Bacteroidetes bacterium]|nr:T9SS type A sorting domain-containing protein [Bacteroidota bacterium]